MELCQSVLDGVALAGEATHIPDVCFQHFITKTIEGVLDKSSRNTIKDDKVFNKLDKSILKEAYSGVLTLLLEAAKFDAETATLSAILEECKFTQDRIDILLQLYQEKKLFIQILLGNIGTSPPHIVDVDWRLDYYIKSNQLEKVNEPVYLISLKTELVMDNLSRCQQTFVNEMAEHSSIDSVTELSGTAKTSSKSDNIFSIMNDHRQLISPGYDNNISGFQASIENINVGGGAMSNAPVTHTPEVVIPDIYNMLLQNQLYIQTLMKNQNSKTDPIQSSTKVNPRQSATMAGPRKVVKSKPKKDDYQSQLDSLFDNVMNNNQTKNISAPSELYSDISSDESYDSDDEACSENKHDEVDVEKAENENVLESMKDFISSDEKTGPKINSGLASYMNQGLRTRVNEEKYKDQVPGKTDLEEVQFSCSLEQLQDFVGKLKDATKCLEKIGQV